MRRVELAEFRNILADCEIAIHRHALNHLMMGNREILKKKQLLRTVTKEDPRGVGVQQNGYYAAFYRRKNRHLKIIIDIQDMRATIITFMFVQNMPDLTRL